MLARINGDEAADAFGKQPKTDAELLRERARLGPVCRHQARMAGQGSQSGQSGCLAEAGRSLGQPEACSGAERASWLMREPPYFPT